MQQGASISRLTIWDDSHCFTPISAHFSARNMFSFSQLLTLHHATQAKRRPWRSVILSYHSRPPNPARICPPLPLIPPILPSCPPTLNEATPHTSLKGATFFHLLPNRQPALKQTDIPKWLGNDNGLCAWPTNSLDLRPTQVPCMKGKGPSLRPTHLEVESWAPPSSVLEKTGGDL